VPPYYARLRAEIERHGGTVEKFIGDAVMAVFGAPVAHEDDPERAVRAALAIRDALSDGELQIRTAANTGEALVALGARPVEGEGMVSGDVVNTTARLQGPAPVNGILVGESTYRATRHAIDYREAPAVDAKGRRVPGIGKRARTSPRRRNALPPPLRRAPPPPLHRIEAWRHRRHCGSRTTRRPRPCSRRIRSPC
jgi:class 3 adenylate cyclase